VALKPCRECKTEISTEAKTCPHCGVRGPTGTTEQQTLARFLLCIVGCFILMASISSAFTGKEVEQVSAAPKQVEVPGAVKKLRVWNDLVIGCAVLNEGALSTGKATGRIFDLSDVDQCRGIHIGTVVVEQKRERNFVCVVPEGASPPCLWVFNRDLAVR
jgi:hypothetical protein